MAQRKTDLLFLLGFSTQGDLGPLTFYTNQRGTLVFYAKAPPLNPPSTLQKIFRQRWASIAMVWRSLTPQEKTNWETAVKRCSLCVTGYNLFVFWQSTQDDSYVKTIERQSGINLIS